MSPSTSAAGPPDTKQASNPAQVDGIATINVQPWIVVISYIVGLAYLFSFHQIDFLDWESYVRILISGFLGLLIFIFIIAGIDLFCQWIRNEINGIPLADRKKRADDGLHVGSLVFRISMVVATSMLILGLLKHIFPSRQIGSFLEAREYVGFTYCQLSRDENGPTYVLPCQTWVNNPILPWRDFAPIRVFFTNGGYLSFTDEDSDSLIYEHFSHTHHLGDQNGNFWNIKIMQINVSNQDMEK